MRSGQLWSGEWGVNGAARLAIGLEVVDEILRDPRPRQPQLRGGYPHAQQTMVVGRALDEVDRAWHDDEVLGVVVDDEVDDALEATSHGEQPHEAVRGDDGGVFGHGEQQRLDLLRNGTGPGWRLGRG